MSVTAATSAAGKSPCSQDAINDFWKNKLTSIKPPNRPFSVLPNDVYARLQRRRTPKGEVKGSSVATSYYEAVKECEAKVAQIVKECKRVNVKYTDPHFDLSNYPDSRESLTVSTDDEDEASSIVMASGPGCVKRVGDIFDNPKFFVGGANASDLRQGREGDCWFISALGSLCVDEEDPLLIEKICPIRARNERVGVYGFVFYRDGEWFSEIVDDKLYLTTPDYDDCSDAKRAAWDQSRFRLDADTRRKEFEKAFQRNSDALFYGSSTTPNETWVPLLEKAFAKAHGDYGAIGYGWQGEGVEDLTGGVTTSRTTNDILDTDELWTNEILEVNKQFLFGAGTKRYSTLDDTDRTARSGVQDGHAYCVQRAVEYKGERLVQLKNPWAQTEWNGPWSDGSKEWTPDALRELEYQFGDDGVFWMSYEDFLRRYSHLNRTRLFTKEWNITQRWNTVQVPWSGEYNDTKFEFTIPSNTCVVIQLSKLDDRYFRGLEGQYYFSLGFRLHRTGEEEHLVRGYESGSRSATTELDLEAGTYDVLLQISAARYDRPKIEDIVKQNWLDRREKLIRTGLSYDLAHAKGQIEFPTSSDDEVKSGKKPKDKAKDTPDSPKTTATDKPTNRSSDAEGEVAQTTDDAVQTATPITTGATPEDDTKSEALTESEKKSDTSVAAQADDNEKPKEKEEEDPWNATCVVGLRVFCHKTAATIKVVTPEVLSDANKAKLDVDDAEKDAAEKSSANSVSGE